MRLFLLGTDVTDDAPVCDLGALGDFVPVDGKKIVSSRGVPYASEKAAYLVGQALAPF